jgi:hypothetical protein
MDFQNYKEEISSSQPRKWTPRQKHIDCLDRALYGELYKHINTPYSREYGSTWSRERISLDKRRASQQYQLPMMIARDLSTRLFGESGRPTILSRFDDYTNAWMQALIDDTFMHFLYIDAAWQGSVGSVAIVTRVLAEEAESEGEQVDKKAPGKFYHEVWPSSECSPVFKRTAPDKLLRLPRTYFAKSDQLRVDGYDVAALEQKWQDKKFGSSRKEIRLRKLATSQIKVSDDWVLRVILDAKSETWFEPIPFWLFETDDFDEDKDWDIDPNRSFDHNLGEVPAIWIRALPTKHAKFPEGGSTFEPIIDYQFRIDRTLSQTGRALDYVGDPQLALKRGSGGSGDFGEDEFSAPEATASDIVEIDPDGDASFLEIRGDGLEVAINTYVKMLRQIAREVGAASRIDPEASPREMSGVAMRMLEHALFGVVGILRVSHCDMGMIPHIRMCMRIADRVKVDLPSLESKLKTSNVSVGKLDPKAAIEVQWPMMPEPSGAEKLAEVQAAMAAASSLNGPAAIGKETLVANIGPLYDVRDPVKELAAIDGEAEEKQANQLDVVDKTAAISAKYAPTPPSA